MLIDDLLNPDYCKRLHVFGPDDEKFNAFAELLHTSALKEATVFNFQDVVVAYEAHSKVKGFDYKRDVFCVLPPFPVTWLEASIAGQRVGCIAVASQEEGDRVIASDLDIGRLKKPIVTDGEIPFVHTGGHDLVLLRKPYNINLHTYIELPSATWLIPGAFIAEADDKGVPLTYPTVSGDIGEWISAEDYKWLHTVQRRIFPFLFGLSLLACKNVTTELVEVSPQLQKARIRRGKQPLKNHYVLNVSTTRKANQPASGEKGEDVTKKRLHTVRGHLADYTKGAGLFGKYQGRFWVPAHTRGSLEQGEIKKSYAVRT